VGLYADGLVSDTLTTGWRGPAVVGGIVGVGLLLLLGTLLVSRRRAEERRQVEVPQFNAAEFQRFTDHQTWITQQVPPVVPPDPPGPPRPPATP
jgi:hypothetical protein